MPILGDVTMRNKVTTNRFEKACEIVERYKTIIIGSGVSTRKLVSHLQEHSFANNIVCIINYYEEKELSYLNGVKLFPLNYLETYPDADYIIVDAVDKKENDEIYSHIQGLSRKYNIVELAWLESFNNRILNDTVLNASTDVDDLLRFIMNFGEMPIAIFQMGKVGSRTIYQSLDEYGVFGWHIHYLSKELNAWRERSQNEMPLPELLRKVSGNDEFKVRIITLVRDPIARNVASYFQNIQKWFPQILTRYENDREETIEFTIDRFLNGWSPYDHNLPLNWWGDELEGVFGINAIDGKFPKGKGYRIIQNEMVELLIIKVESLNEVFNPAIHEFLGIDKLQLCLSNLGDEKPYNQLYRDFIDKIRIPADYLERHYQSDAVMEFYTNDEIDGFLKKWKHE